MGELTRRRNTSFTHSLPRCTLHREKSGLEDIARRPFITIGFTALLMLVPLAVTSTNGMMRRLGARWKTLHRLIYPIALLGVWHYYWQVKADVREPLVYLAVLLLLLGWRARRRLGVIALHRRANAP
ncbi:MAG TPA: ferric reductase-like transmembrane domain-containing protein [Steroidobacter sp.]|nr:ferric reductase-like transmembrane domain-containing protein [Steroidobacter sp.]